VSDRKTANTRGGTHTPAWTNGKLGTTMHQAAFTPIRNQNMGFAPPARLLIGGAQSIIYRWKAYTYLVFGWHVHHQAASFKIKVATWWRTTIQKLVKVNLPCTIRLLRIKSWQLSGRTQKSFCSSMATPRTLELPIRCSIRSRSHSRLQCWRSSIRDMAFSLEKSQLKKFLVTALLCMTFSFRILV